MRLARGLFRLWVSSCVVFSIGTVIFFLSDAMVFQRTYGQPTDREQTWFWIITNGSLLIIVGCIGLGVLMLLLGVLITALRWIANGFRS